MLVRCAAALAVSVVAAPVLAADLPGRPIYKAPPPDAVSTWTGFYIGAQVGWASADWDASSLVSTPPIGPFAAPGFPIGTFNGDGFVGGVHVGYNHQFNNIVLGIEADFNWPDVDVTRNFVAIGIQPGLPLAINASLDSYGTIRGRFGVTWGRALLYGTAGWAWARSEISITSPGQFAGPFATTSRNTHNGWTAGVGVDYMVTPNFIVGVEYKHLGFDSETYTFAFPLATSVTSSVDLDVDEVTIRAKWKF
jgi:outer membrane immunogenic protein